MKNMKYLKFSLIFFVIILIKNYWPAHHNVKRINNSCDNIKAFKTSSNSDNLTKYNVLKDYDFKNYCFKKDIYNITLNFPSKGDLFTVITSEKAFSPHCCPAS